MDSLQANNVMKRMLGNASVNDDNLCILVNGRWGIGKTYLIKNFFEQNADDYDLVYISLFGKESIKEIERSLLLNLIPGFKSIEGYKGFVKFVGTLLKDVIGEVAKVNVEDYINLFSIENMRCNKINGKEIVICLDDLERKSDAIEMKDLLGLIERALTNFNVILIANTKKINEGELRNLKTYKEKVIDHVIKIDKLNRNVLEQILESMNVEDKDEIIDVYLEKFISLRKTSSSEVEENMSNLRIFIKYVELVLRTKELMKIERLDLEILRMCAVVVYDYYFSSGKEHSVNFDRFNIYNTLKKILLFEDIPDDSFKEYFNKTSEIRKDIRKLHILYTLNENEFKALFGKIKENVYKKNKDYFINQENIISLVSALAESNILQMEMFRDLLYIAKDMYNPEKHSKYIPFKHTMWSDIDMHGNKIECDKRTKCFIEKLNEHCKFKFKHFIKEKREYCKAAKDFDKMLDLLNYYEVDDLAEFEEVFDYYFSILEREYSEDVERKIRKLINRTNSEIIRDFFVKRLEKEQVTTNRSKYKHFDDILDMKMREEAKVESYIEDME